MNSRVRMVLGKKPEGEGLALRFTETNPRVRMVLGKKPEGEGFEPSIRLYNRIPV